jgi:hypothetical protein
MSTRALIIRASTLAALVTTSALCGGWKWSLPLAAIPL